MIRENWQPIHYCITLFAVIGLLVILKRVDYVKQTDQNDLKIINDSTHVEHMLNTFQQRKGKERK